MGEYENLVDRLAQEITRQGRAGMTHRADRARAVLALILRTLETVTPEMIEAAAIEVERVNAEGHGDDWRLTATAAITGALHTSPLSPPKA
jgi:hypothetical protein